MTTLERLMTAEELFDAAGLGPCELLRGELVAMTPAGFEHGRIANRIAVRLGSFVEKHSLGIVTTAETGFLIASDPDTVRVPDIAFVSAAHVPPTAWARFFNGPPDLAVEVLSPSDRASEVLAKVQEWLAAGCRAVWLIDPPSRTLTVYGPRREALVLRESDTLDGGDLLPGFSVPMADVLGE